MSNDQSSAQAQFDQRYISSNEIQRTLRISASAIVQARKRGLLPAPIVIGVRALYLWEREQVVPFLDAWHINIKARRRELTA